MIGQTIAHYRIIEKLGSGGMGEVYLADDTKLHRKVALKFLPESLSHDPEARERLLREARAASKLSHSNIVTIYAVEHEAGRDFIAMEYIDGRPLDAYMRERPRTLEEILRLAVQMARGLEHAHKQGVVHRDLKPANIFIDREDRVRILDFGLARVQGSDRLTQTGSTMGTIAYMSPEQVQGKDADERSDIFSFGILIYEMLAGHAPFSGDHHAALMYAIMNETPEPISQKRPDTPPGLTAIVAKTLEKEPLRRYPSATELVADLRRERDARTSSPSQPSVTSVVSRRKFPRLAIPAAAAVVVIVVLLVLQPWKLEIAPLQDAEAVADRLAIMYFDNVLDPGDPQRFGEIATHLLIADLSESQHMQIVSNQRLYDILKLLGREGQKSVDRDVATQVAAKARAKWMLMGSILQTEPRFVLTSQIVESETGTTVSSQVIEGHDGETIFSLVGRLAQEVASDLAIPEPVEAGTTLTLEATNSTDAYRHYLNGLDLIRQFYFLEAETEFRKAIEIDTSFAMAYFALYQYARGAQDEMELWLNKAKRFSDKLSRRDRMYVEAYLTGREQGLSAEITKLTQIIQEFPDDTEIMLALASRLSNQGRLSEAVTVAERIIAIDSLEKNAYNQLAYTFDDLGDLEKSLQAIDRYIELAPNEANPYDTRGDLYANNGKFDDAKQSYQKAIEINPNFLMSREKLGYLHILTRDFPAAESCFRAMTTFSHKEVRSSGRSGLAAIHSHQGRLRKAIEVLDSGLEADRMEQYSGWPYIGKFLDKVFLLDELGEYDEERSTMEQAFTLSTAMNPRGTDWMLGYFAVLAEKMGDPRKADSILTGLYKLVAATDTARIDLYYFSMLQHAIVRGNVETVRAYVDSTLQRTRLEDMDYYHKECLARSYLLMSQPADAIPLIEELVTRTFDEEAVRDPVNLITLHYYLAQAYEMSGWTKKAIERYEHFLELWHDPDPELTKIADAKTRIARLKAGA